MLEKSTIIIPTVDNCEYLIFCINSIKKNSFFNHEIIVHLNGLDHESEAFLKDSKIHYTKSNINIGLCSGVNLASKQATTNFIIYAHDDMYFLPKWDFYLFNEVNDINHNNF